MPVNLSSPVAPSQPAVLEVDAKALLFDMDGVLISSIGSVRRCWRQWCRTYGVANADTFEFTHGMRAVELVRSLRPDIDPEEGLRVIEDLELADTADLVILPGARELLASLPSDRWTIVTSATRRLLLGRLDVAGLPVPARLVAADDVVHGKPHPEPYLRGAAALGFDPQDCVVVEDAPAGIAAGRAAGCRVLGVLGTHPPHELSEATWIVDSLRQVSAALRGDRLVLRVEPSTAVKTQAG